MRHTEFWARMERALGPAYARSWATQVAMPALDHRTVQEGFASGCSPKEIWQAVWETLELPPSER
ncbi:MAG: DUF3046 domain-containing protein [Nocardioidaceae bacterium]